MKAVGFCHYHAPSTAYHIQGSRLLHRGLHERLPKLLKPGGVYSFFNGLAPDNPFFQAVYAEIVKREMAQLGIETTFVPLPIDASSSATWTGVKHRRVRWCCCGRGGVWSGTGECVGVAVDVGAHMVRIPSYRDWHLGPAVVLCRAVEWHLRPAFSLR